MTEAVSSSSSSSSKLSFPAIVVIAANTMNGPGLTTLPSIASASGQVTFSLLVALAALIASFVVHRLVSVMWVTHQHQPSGPGTPTAAAAAAATAGAPPAAATTLQDGDDEELDKLVGSCMDDGTSLNIVVRPHSIDTTRPKLEETDIVALSARLFDQKKLVSLVMVGCALSLALAQMMLCAAIADSMLVASVGKSCGVGPFDVYCTSNLSMKPFQTIPATPENDQAMDASTTPVSLISAGLVLSSSITIFLSLVDLDSLVVAQYFLFGCLLLACSRFCSTLRDMGDALPDFVNEEIILPNLPDTTAYWVGPRPFDAVGPALFNFAFVVTAPPLVCGTDSPAAGSRALVVACLLMGALYMVVGRMGANAATKTTFGLDDNLLSLVLRGRHPDSLNAWDIGAVSLFGFSQLAAIPVYCELARQTLMTHLKVSNNVRAFVMSHVCPWMVVALTYNSALFEAFVEWSSLLLLGFANFSLPLLLDHVYTQRLIHTEREKLHERETQNCPSRVVWGLALITAGIAAVIVQRLSGNLVLAEVVFMVTTLTLFQVEYSR